MMKPEMKILSVSMNESIASSGGNILEIMHQKKGMLADEWESYPYMVNSASKTIVDTSVPYFYTSSDLNTNYYTLASKEEVNSCMA